MPLFTIQRRCNDCEQTRDLVRELRKDTDAALARYEELYQIVRRNLSKLAKQAREGCPDSEEAQNAPQIASDPMGQYRKALLQRKLARRVNGVQ